MTNLIGRINKLEKVTIPKTADLRDTVIEVYQRDGIDFYTSKIDGKEYKVSEAKGLQGLVILPM